MFDYNPEPKTYINWRYVGLAVDPTEFQFSAITPTVFSEKVYSWKLFAKNNKHITLCFTSRCDRC